jgi:hypothetical protein
MTKTKLTKREAQVALVFLQHRALTLPVGDTRRGVLSGILKKLGKRLKKGEGG